MDIDLRTLLGLLAQHGGTLSWAVIQGVLLWGLAAPPAPQGGAR